MAARKRGSGSVEPSKLTKCSEGYRIIIPSRQRLKAIEKSAAIFQSATILVDQREVAEYSKVVDPSRIESHGGFNGFAPIFNWCLDHFPDEVLVFCDDDIVGIHTTTPPSRKLSPAESIAVIENLIQAITDLDLTVGCFSRSANHLLFDPVNEPIRPTQPVCCCFVVREAARRRLYDPALVGRGDVDWTLKTFRDDRVIYCDVRFTAVAGRAFGGAGGNVGIVDSTQRDRATRILKTRWGKFVNNKPNNFSKNRTVVPLRLAITRKNPTAVG